MDKKGGLAVGNSHDEGGIKAKVKSTGQNIEFEGGEVIVNKRNVADDTKLEFEGEKKTTCEILSDLNSRNNNGVKLDCDSVEGKKYKYAEGGQVQFIDYKDNKIMFEPIYKEYFVDDEQFKTLEEAQAFIDLGSPISDWKKDAYRKGLFKNGGALPKPTKESYEKELQELKRLRPNLMTDLSRYRADKKIREIENILGHRADLDWYREQKRKNIFAEMGVKIANIIYPSDTLGLTRDKMPQIRSKYMDALLSKLDEDGIDYNYTVEYADDLKPTQSEINLDKVETLTEDYVNKKNIITSNDGYVLDGHHRWYWLKLNDSKVKALQIDLPIRELIDYLKTLSFVEYQAIDCPITFALGGSLEDKIELFVQARQKFIPQQQVAYLMELEEDGGADPLESRDMILNVVKAINDMPPARSQEGKGHNSVVYLHYFNSNSDWYIIDYDEEEDEFFGYSVINGDGSFGYISREFLVKNDLPYLMKPELDFYFKYQTLNEILENKYPEFVKGKVEKYSETKNDSVNSTDWTKLINDNKFNNPFEKVKAIEQMIDEKGEDPNNYSVVEKAFLSEYTGIGGLEKFGAKRRDVGFGKDFDYGLLTEYFTPTDVCRIMWGLAYKHSKNIEIKDVLEPSMGSGAFISQAPLNVNIDGYDINKYCYIINKILYTDKRFNFHHSSFEELFIRKNTSVKSDITPQFDLVIGNPPYGKYSGMYSAMGEKKYTKAEDFIDYFISRGLDLLRPNGLLIYVIGSVSALGGVQFLDKKMFPSKSRIIAKSELVDAYRIGNDVFENTSVDADIIVLRKK
jgi:hypothetical protein